MCSGARAARPKIGNVAAKSIARLVVKEGPPPERSAPFASLMKSSGKLPDSLRSPHTDMNAHGRLCVFKRQNSKRDSFLANAMERLAKPEAEPAAARATSRASTFDDAAQLPADVRIAAFRERREFLARQHEQMVLAGQTSPVPLPLPEPGAPAPAKWSTSKPPPEARAKLGHGVLAGEACNERQLQLSNEVAWTGRCHPAARSNYGLPIRGEICQDPVMARVMMSRRQKSQMTIPARPMDFRNETEWRLKLRGGLGPVPLH